MVTSGLWAQGLYYRISRSDRKKHNILQAVRRFHAAGHPSRLNHGLRILRLPSRFQLQGWGVEGWERRINNSVYVGPKPCFATGLTGLKPQANPSSSRTLATSRETPQDSNATLQQHSWLLRIKRTRLIRSFEAISVSKTISKDVNKSDCKDVCQP